MSSSIQFKRVNGRSEKVESICMRCLLAVGISSSDEELAAKERQHECKSEEGKSELGGT
jgi:hypothetical protein